MSVALAIETATDLGSVAVGVAGEVLSEVPVGTRRHAAELLPAALEALSLAKAAPADVTQIVVGDGPGSFTGLRIGFATAKAFLRAGENITLHTAPSLCAAAFGARALAQGPVAALYGALRGDVFAAVYGFDDASVRTHLAPTCLRLEDVIARSPVVPGVAVGDGALEHPDLVREWTGRDPAGPPEVVPRAGALLELLALTGGTVLLPDPDTVEPTYGRPAEAQARWEREHGKPLPDSGVRPR
jgi:tRNA threonylcarbamoyladenosine biosynthesis protein TsaB